MQEIDKTKTHIGGYLNKSTRKNDSGMTAEMRCVLFEWMQTIELCH